jgi:uncharacterized protein with HEPN domain
MRSIGPPRRAHDNGAVDFKIVWEVTRTEIGPLLSALEDYFTAE